MVDNLVDAGWLKDNLQNENVKIVDGSWHLPTSGRNAEEEFLAAHVPGAVYFNIDQCVSESELPHMLPTADGFADYAANLGISEKDHIVVYDSVGVFSAARVWWMFRRYGAQQVSVLNGGLPAWLQSNFSTQSGSTASPKATFNVPESLSRSTHQVVDAPQVLSATTEDNTLILDARSPGRFAGTEKEFRPGLRSGHIPGSTNVPFTDLLENGFFKPDDELRILLAQAGVSNDVHVITSCGSGVTAAVLCLALERIGIQQISLYDGSWTEWGALRDYPVAEGQGIN